MYSKINVAVAGTGFIGPVHVEALRRLGVRVKGILGSSPGKSLKAAERLGLQVGYNDFHEILTDPELHAVHIATPNVMHYAMAKDVLVAGKHVMCEKPLAMSSQETEEMVRLATESGLVAAVTYNVRFYPMNLEAQLRVKRGDVGRVFSVTGSYLQDWLLYDNDYNWRVSAEKGGALRAVADIGTHWMDLIHSITGLEVAEVFADLSTVHPQRSKPLGEVETFSGREKSGKFETVDIDTDDCGSILFRYKQGGQGALWVSQVSAGFKNRIRYEISGSRKSICWDSDEANQLLVGHRDRANEIVEKDPALVETSVARFVDYPGGHSEGFPDTFKQCFRAFYDVILNDGHNVDTLSYASFAEGHQEVQLCEAILKSHLTHRWVQV